ncbi:MAG: hypothetical protein IKP00_07195, partial [Victivallales bacterium]|nr:hypothetical protein [Victivallales bacterium]
QDAPCRFAALRGTAQQGSGWSSDRGFRFAAIAASLHPRLCSDRRLRGFASPTAILLPPLSRLRFTHGMTLSSRCALPLRCATRHGATGIGGASDRGFRFAAIAASLHPRLYSCRRYRGFASPTAMLLPPLVNLGGCDTVGYAWPVGYACGYAA